jgi:hypothetical protein
MDSIRIAKKAKEKKGGNSVHPLTNLHHRYINIAVRGPVSIEGIEGQGRNESGNQVSSRILLGWQRARIIATIFLATIKTIEPLYRALIMASRRPSRSDEPTVYPPYILDPRARRGRDKVSSTTVTATNSSSFTFTFIVPCAIAAALAFSGAPLSFVLGQNQRANYGHEVRRVPAKCGLAEGRGSGA